MRLGLPLDWLNPATRPDRGTFVHLRSYLLIGSTCFVIDFGTLTLLLRKGIDWPIAVVSAFVLANVVQFLLNKYANFKNHDRRIEEQFSTYLVVVGTCLLITVIATDFFVRVLHTSPLLGKLVAVALNVPIGFFGHRYLTFKNGIFALLRNDRSDQQ